MNLHDRIREAAALRHEDAFLHAIRNAPPMLPRFADSPATAYWGRACLDRDGRAPQRHVRVYWNVNAAGRVAEVGIAFLPAGKLRDAEHPAYTATLSLFETYVHADGNITADWLAGRRTIHDVWHDLEAKGFASAALRARALEEIANVAEGDFAREALATLPPVEVDDLDGDPIELDQDNPTTRAARVIDIAMIENARTGADFEAIGRRIWCGSVSSTRARRVGGQLWRLVSDPALAQVWLDGAMAVHHYEHAAGRTYVMGWRATGSHLVPTEVVAAVAVPGMSILASADDPDAHLWADEAPGFFRRGGA
jgi:hypothetical protein